MHYDVFNGDADGIIALLQLRLANPQSGQLVTGVKRDIELVKQIENQRNLSSAIILDISMDKNKTSLLNILNRNIPVFYCDHHFSGDIPQYPNLEALINPDAEICTSLLINQKLQGKYVDWAIAAAFGDNLHSRAEAIGKTRNLSAKEMDFLCELGTLINYNGYGASLDDLHIPPADLFRQLLNYPDPFALQSAPDSVFFQLRKGYDEDYAHTQNLNPIETTSECRIFELPDAGWARRISGVLSNELANQRPEQAHAVLTLNPNHNDYTVSVRAPLNNRVGADEICRQFSTGGGRKAAAGINALPREHKQHFIDVFNGYYTDTALK